MIRRNSGGGNRDASRGIGGTIRGIRKGSSEQEVVDHVVLRVEKAERLLEEEVLRQSVENHVESTMVKPRSIQSCSYFVHNRIEQ